MKIDRIASDKQLSLPLENPEDEPVNGEPAETKSNELSSIMQRVLDPENLKHAYLQVYRNRGAPGIDGISVDELSDFLKAHWRHDIRNRLIVGDYKPQPVKRVNIPKADGGVRPLGIPTVLDRFIQQAIAQVLQQIWEPNFHECSFGFRPNRNAHQAIRYVQGLVRSDYKWVVDCDLEKFFEKVNHDLLIVKLKETISDPVLLRLINRFLKAGVLSEGMLLPSTEGVPQGGPLSPVLSNIMLNGLDWELERRGHKFARYADDLQIYVKSQRAGDRVLKSTQRFVEKKLRLKVNENKSAVDRPWKRTFLGFTLGGKRGYKIKVSDKALQKLKATVRTLSRRTRGHSLIQIIEELRKYLLGWKAYFDISEVLSPLRDLDKWIRRRLRCYVWKQWGRSGYRQLRLHGVDRWLAWNTAKSAHGPWRLSASPALYRAMPNSYFIDLGLPCLVAR